MLMRLWRSVGVEEGDKEERLRLRMGGAKKQGTRNAEECGRLTLQQ